MNEDQILQEAIQSLSEEGMGLKRMKSPKEDFGVQRLALSVRNGATVKLYAEIKKELRSFHITGLEVLAKREPGFIVVCERIFPKIKQELRRRKINYLEANGNMFLSIDGLHINIDGKSYVEPVAMTTNRAFTKIGLQVLYQFMINDEWVNKTYRELAELTGVGIGTISNIIKGLKKDGYLLQLTKDMMQLEHKGKLLEKWVVEYDKRLKPALALGTFRFLNQDDFYAWENISLLAGKSFWGGEPAGALYTKFLRPEELTIYTEEGINDLIRNYKLIPDRKGNVVVYKKFWVNNDTQGIIVDPLLVYTDLINKLDRRCTEIAQKIYDERLQDKF